MHFIKLWEYNKKTIIQIILSFLWTHTKMKNLTNDTKQSFMNNLFPNNWKYQQNRRILGYIYIFFSTYYKKNFSQK